MCSRASTSRRSWPERGVRLGAGDLNHEGPAGVSEGKDRRALEAVVALDGAELLARCRRERISMCGRAPAATVLAASVALGGGAGGDARAAVAHYSHSGMTTGDDDAAVGYGGVVITGIPFPFSPPPRPPPGTPRPPPS